jgi:arsenite-transporting ATPase
VPPRSVVRDAIGNAPVVFVVGKGGTGKSTAAAALALELADEGTATHIISTDPAHSLRDVFVAHDARGVITSHCSHHLQIEEFDAATYADAWLARALPAVTQLVESGTYLDADDVKGFSRLALPGLDELMAVLRLVDLRAAAATIVVDTAPTGHTLRLLDAGATHSAIAHALRAMADKAATVASSFAGHVVRLHGEDIIDELQSYVTRFQQDVLQQARFVIAARAGSVVTAETERLMRGLRQRNLAIAAVVYPGDPGPAGGDTVRAVVPWLPHAVDCDGLRAWRAAVVRADGATEVEQHPPTAVRGGDPAVPWLEQRSLRLLLFAGKGGVGKTTCAAAAALTLSRTRRVLLCSTDPAGSLDDVFGTHVTGSTTGNVRVLQIDAEQQLARLREQYRSEVLEALERIGLSEAATLDRRVIDALWELAPPGIDEFAALAALLDAAEHDETIVLDTAPTGHFLRLLTMPQIALDWVRQLMRIIVKYHAAGAAGGAAESLLQSARELRALQDLLHDAARTGVFVVTLDEAVVEAETERLVDTLAAADVPVAAIVRNRAQRAHAWRQHETIIAPLQSPAPVGEDALREFAAHWNIVS